MFRFDPVSLPQLTTRKALIAVDFQNDFVGPDAALPVVEPEGFLDRATDLAAAFREAGGDVVWVQSSFEQPRPVDSEQILTSDIPTPPARGASRGRRRPPPVPSQVADAEPDPEAFLSHAQPLCLKPGTPGVQLVTAVNDSIRTSDTTLNKSHYSAFQGTSLLKMLRAKMAIDVFICGSLANIGVYATALDAAGHGFNITVVEDCSGWRSETRQVLAVKSLIELTGCEIASAEEVLETIRPKPAPKTSRPSRPSKKPASSSSSNPPPRTGPSMSPGLTQPMTELKISSDLPAPSTVKSAKHAENGPTDESGPSKNPKGEAKATEVCETSDKVTKSTPDSKAETGPSKETEEVTDGIAKVKLETSQPPEDTSDVTAETSTVESKHDSKEPKPSLPTTQNLKTSNSESTQKEMDKKEVDEDTVAEVQPLPLQQKGLCAGDTDVIEDLLPQTLEKEAFYKLKDEVSWQRMSHQGGEVPRLVAVQGVVADDGSMPVYRHPSDESPPLLPFSPTVLAIKQETEKHLGHPLNHVLIQYYRDGTDYISEHSDKTLDIVRGSYIANVSLGAQRTMVLRTKRMDKDPSLTRKPPSTTPANTSEDKKEEKEPPTPPKRQVQRALLPHNSLCRMGLRTNMQWLHSIRQDKRADRDKTPAELAYAGGRISLTFRNIGTFLSADETTIWGQGATGKTRADAQSVINGQNAEAVKMLQAFGAENHSSTFDWKASYGKGFDVLHMSSSPRLFASSDAVVNLRIALMLAEFGIGYARGSMGPASSSNVSKKDTESKDAQSTEESEVAIKYADNDVAKSVVHGDMAIMMYLDARHSQTLSTPATPSELAARFTRFQQGLGLLGQWRRAQQDADMPKSWKQELKTWNCHITSTKEDYLAGSAPSLPDFAVWPVLHDMVEKRGLDVFEGLEGLRAYYEKVADRQSTRTVLGKPEKADTEKKPDSEQNTAVEDKTAVETADTEVKAKDEEEIGSKEDANTEKKANTEKVETKKAVTEQADAEKEPPEKQADTKEKVKAEEKAQLDKTDAKVTVEAEEKAQPDKSEDTKETA